MLLSLVVTSFLFEIVRALVVSKEQFCKIRDSGIDVGTGGLGARAPHKDFAINKEVPFLFLESAPFS